MILHSFLYFSSIYIELFGCGRVAQTLYAAVGLAHMWVKKQISFVPFPHRQNTKTPSKPARQPVEEELLELDLLHRSSLPSSQKPPCLYHNLRPPCQPLHHRKAGRTLGKQTPKHNVYSMLIFYHTHHHHPNPFTWNTIIQGFSISNTPLHTPSPSSSPCSDTPSKPKASPSLRPQGLHPLLRASARRVLHTLVVMTGHDLHIFILNTAMHAYSSWSNVGNVRKLFEKMVNDVIRLQNQRWWEKARGRASLSSGFRPNNVKRRRRKDELYCHLASDPTM